MSGWWRPTIRVRLTLLYGGLFLVAGVVLLGVTYVLVANNLQERQPVVSSMKPQDGSKLVYGGSVPMAPPPRTRRYCRNGWTRWSATSTRPP
ncbi:hypothetical protein [Thermomonospora amylolytica]|uniref:hypothetical protein n=1 Tax=Thermomonospora amylolytica TaxID=1411117 RepID=UPI0018E553B9|nr:hypothetical protein [Thermomonospora amylolytica]